MNQSNSHLKLKDLLGHTYGPEPSTYDCLRAVWAKEWHIRMRERYQLEVATITLIHFSVQPRFPECSHSFPHRWAPTWHLLYTALECSVGITKFGHTYDLRDGQH